MAEASVALKGGSAPVNPAAAGTAGNQARVSSAPAEAKSITDVFSLCQQPSVLSKDGVAYVEKIVETVRGSGRDEVEMIPVTGSGYEARVIVYNDQIVAFLFQETYVPTADGMPLAACRDDFKNQLLALKKDPAKIIQFIVVTKEDYAKVDIMAAYVTNLFVGEDQPIIKNLTAAQFQGNNFRITTDINVVRQYVASTYPLATLPRMDVGMLLFATKPVPNSFDVSGRPEIRQVPIVAVTGYTDFEYATSGNIYGQQTTKFAPMFNVTGVHSKIVSEKMGIVGLSLASYLFNRNYHWLEQFSTFQKGAPDIGNLLTDDKGKLVHASNVLERNRVLDMALNTKLPYLNLDLQLGGPMIPGFKRIIEDKAVFNESVDAFTGGSGARTAQNPFQLLKVRFDGRLRLAKNGMADFSDTRSVDYLSLVQSGANPGDCTEFLNPSPEPKGKADALRNFYKDAEMLYVTYRVMLNPTWVDAIAADLGQTVKVQVDTQFTQNTYDVSQLAAFQPMGIGMMPAFMASSNFNSFTGGFFC